MMRAHLKLFARSQKLAAALPPLLVQAERAANTVWQGLHGRRRAGVGEDFWQFRPYDAGDPADRIDWRQSARSDKLFVRLREWEAVQNLCLWADASASMHYASDNKLPSKAEAGRVLLLALASLAMRGGEKVFWSNGAMFQPLHGKPGLEHVAVQASNAPNSLLPLPPVTRHMCVVLASDFLMPKDELTERMQNYTAQNARGILLHIIDPLEQSFALSGRVELQGVEGEASLLVAEATSMRALYQEKFAEHQSYLQHVARSAGWQYRPHRSDQSPLPVLQELYHDLAG